jgi:hypothetical protein
MDDALLSIWILVTCLDGMILITVKGLLLIVKRLLDWDGDPESGLVMAIILGSGG